MTTTTAKGIPVPEEADPPLVPQDLGNVANWIDTNPGVATMTQAQIDGLAGVDRWLGRVLYNSTTSQHQGWNGSTWLPIGAGVQSMTQAQLDALPAGQKSNGMIVWNSTLGEHQAWTGLAWDWVNNVPTLSAAQRDGLAFKNSGSIIYNVTAGRQEWYDGAAWRALTPGSAGAYGVAAFTSTFTTSALSVLTTVASVTFTALAGRRYVVGGYVEGLKDASAANIEVLVKDGATTLMDRYDSIAANAYISKGLDGTFVGGAASRSVTIIVQLFPTAGSFTPVRGLLVVTDEGEDGQVTTPTNIVPPDIWNAAWGTIATPAARVSAYTMTATETGVTTLTCTPQVGRRYKLRASFATYYATGGGTFNGYIRRGAAVSGVQIDRVGVAIGNATNYDYSLEGFDEGPFDGTSVVTYTLSVSSSVGAALDVGVAPARLWIEDVGPVNAAAPSNWPPKGGGTKVFWTPIVRQTNPVTGTMSIADLTRVGDRVSGELVWNATAAGAAVRLVVDWPYGWKPAAFGGSIGAGYIYNGSTNVLGNVAADPNGLALIIPSGYYAVALASGHALSYSFSYLSAN